MSNIYSLKILIPLMVFSGWILFGFFCAALFSFLTAIAWFFPPCMKTGLIIIFIIILLGVIYTFIMVFSALLKREIIPFFRTRYICMKYIVPIARSAAKRLSLNPDKAVRSFISLSNDFILKDMRRKAVNKVMLMLPHCIQLHSCGMKLTSDIHNCKRCGKCIISSLIELSERLSVLISVASGGTMARKQLKETLPDLVIAVACERDLLSGIRDTLPMPVLGVTNERPNGPCMNTTVDTEKIANLIKYIKKENK